jgi:hypothetical protein
MVDWMGIVLEEQIGALYSVTMMKKLGSPRAGRIAFSLGCFLILLLGVGTLLQGNMGYRNWWGGVVFAPFAILIGVLGLFIVGFKPKLFSGTDTRTKSRIRGWPTGRAR